MDDAKDLRRTGITGAAERLITIWALLGGGMLLFVVAVNVISVLGAVVWKPFPGDFELTEMGVAVAVFAFLPWCQLTGANVTADIFTARAGPRTIAALRVLGSVLALVFAVLLLWKMYDGMLSQKQYNYTTTILQLKIWWAYVPCLISLTLLAVAAVVSILEAGRALRSGDMTWIR